MTKDLLAVEHRDQVGHWALNRPEAMNALNGELLSQLAVAVDQAGRDPDAAEGVLAFQQKRPARFRAS